MNTNKLRWILYLIVLVIASTIAIQVYWNYKNYQTNKQQLINDVQVSLDKSVDSYYENLTKNNTLGLVFNQKKKTDFFEDSGQFPTILRSINLKEDGSMNIDSIKQNTLEHISVFEGLKADSLKLATTSKKNHFNLSTEEGKANFKKFTDSVKTLNKNKKPQQIDRLKDFEFLTSQVIISMTNDSVRLGVIDSLLHIELNRKALNLDFGLTLNQPKKETQVLNAIAENNQGLSTTSKSTFLPEESVLKVHFKNETRVILKRIISGIFISTLLVLAVIACLFYLLKIINQQKQLAEVKNDLISNITHEFKTPIATISVALESIRDFNVIEDKAKTEKYIDMSSTQLSKLNIMVEKLLETATLDSENLNLNKEPIDLAKLLETLVEKHQMQTQHKTLNFKTSAEIIIGNVDIFHFENALNNIIDNAIKYGGDFITVSIENKKNQIKISIEDNDNTLTKQQASQIFEKFYRVPKGNTHDVKGFGIGLYYTKKIIEKHQGTITTDVSKNTTFKIMIPNER